MITPYHSSIFQLLIIYDPLVNSDGYYSDEKPSTFEKYTWTINDIYSL